MTYVKKEKQGSLLIVDDEQEVLKALRHSQQNSVKSLIFLKQSTMIG